ncbi:MAG: hypothetical protein NZ518_01765 [Dehalococcoidia bacterium]|nr:hypothetical protein [Dehalococcoidia bacterium]
MNRAEKLDVLLSKEDRLLLLEAEKRVLQGKLDANERMIAILEGHLRQQQAQLAEYRAQQTVIEQVAATHTTLVERMDALRLALAGHLAEFRHTHEQMLAIARRRGADRLDATHEETIRVVAELMTEVPKQLLTALQRGDRDAFAAAQATMRAAEDRAFAHRVAVRAEYDEWLNATYDAVNQLLVEFERDINALVNETQSAFYGLVFGEQAQTASGVRGRGKTRRAHGFGKLRRRLPRGGPATESIGTPSFFVDGRSLDDPPRRPTPPGAAPPGAVTPDAPPTLVDGSNGSHSDPITPEAVVALPATAFSAFNGQATYDRTVSAARVDRPQALTNGAVPSGDRSESEAAPRAASAIESSSPALERAPTVGAPPDTAPPPAPSQPPTVATTPRLVADPVATTVPADENALAWPEVPVERLLSIAVVERGAASLAWPDPSGNRDVDTAPPVVEDPPRLSFAPAATSATSPVVAPDVTGDAAPVAGLVDAAAASPVAADACGDPTEAPAAPLVRASEIVVPSEEIRVPAGALDRRELASEAPVALPTASEAPVLPEALVAVTETEATAVAVSPTDSPTTDVTTTEEPVGEPSGDSALKAEGATLAAATSVATRPVPDSADTANGPMLATELRRAQGPATAKAVVSPFPNFTTLIRFDAAIKNIEAIRRFHSRTFRGGRLEFTFDYDAGTPIAEEILRIPGLRLELLSANDETYVFRLVEIDTGKTASRGN